MMLEAWMEAGDVMDKKNEEAHADKCEYHAAEHRQ